MKISQASPEMAEAVKALDDNEPATDSNSGSKYTCEVCGIPLEYGGKGRPPTKCDEHKANKSSSSSGSSKTKTTRKIALLIDQLEGFYMIAGHALTTIPSAQHDGTVIANNARKLAESWETLLETNPNVRKQIERLVTGGGWGSVTTAHLMVALAIANNHGVIEKIQGIKKDKTDKKGTSDDRTKPNYGY